MASTIGRTGSGPMYHQMASFDPPPPRPSLLREHRGARASALEGPSFGPTGAAMSPTHNRKGNRLYR